MLVYVVAISVREDILILVGLGLELRPFIEIIKYVCVSSWSDKFVLGYRYTLIIFNSFPQLFHEKTATDKCYILCTYAYRYII